MEMYQFMKMGCIADLGHGASYLIGTHNKDHEKGVIDCLYMYFVIDLVNHVWFQIQFYHNIVSVHNHECHKP